MKFNKWTMFMIQLFTHTIMSTSDNNIKKQMYYQELNKFGHFLNFSPANLYILFRPGTNNDLCSARLSFSLGVG